MKRTTLTLALTLALPLAVSAQEHPGEHGMDHGRMMQDHHGMMGGGMAMMMMANPGPGMLLRMKGALELSEDQVERLEAMHADARTAMQEHMEAAEAARSRAHEAMTGDTPDLAAFEAALQEAATHQVEAQVAMARVHTEAGQVLTDAQRETLHTVMQAMHEMRGGMHGEGEHPPMREGGHPQGMGRSGA